jgi:hypothetical protein
LLATEMGATRHRDDAGQSCGDGLLHAPSIRS